MSFYTIVSMVLTSVAPIALEWLMKRLPAFKPHPLTQKTRLELLKTYGNWQVASGLLFIATFVLFTLSGWLAAYLVSAYFSSGSISSETLPAGSGDSQFILNPRSYFWAVPFAILSYFLAGRLVNRYLLRRLGVFGFQEFCDYANMTHGYDTYKAKKIALYLLTPPALLALLLGLDNRLVITPWEIRINPFWGIGEQHYSIAQIERISLVKSRRTASGNIDRKPSYTFLLNGDYEYDFRDTLLDPGRDKQREVAHYLSERTNRRIEIIDPYPVRPSK